VDIYNPLREFLGKVLKWIIFCVSWIYYLPTLISPFWAISGIILWMFIPVGIVGMFYIFLGFEEYHPIYWVPWLRLYIPWIPIIMYPSTRWLIDMRVYAPNEWEPYLNVFRSSLILLGMFLFVVGFVQILIAKKRNEGLVTKGLYSRIRHPQYLGIVISTFGLLLFALRPADFISWATLMFLYLLLAESEEKHLEKIFGEEYRKYKNETPFILPFLRLKLFEGVIKALPKDEWKRKGIFFLIYVLVLTVLLLILKTVARPIPFY